RNAVVLYFHALPHYNRHSHCGGNRKEEEKMAFPTRREIMNAESKNAVPAPAHARGIQIRNFRPADRNTLKGFFSVVMPPGMIVNDIALHVKGDSRWVTLPAREWTNSERERKWAPIVEFTTRDVADRFRDAVLAALDHHVQQQEKNDAT